MNVIEEYKRQKRDRTGHELEMKLQAKKGKMVSYEEAYKISNDMAQIYISIKDAAVEAALAKEGFGKKRLERVKADMDLFFAEASDFLTEKQDTDGLRKWLDEKLDKVIQKEKEHKAEQVKTYLSRDEREMVLMIIALAGQADYFADHNTGMTESERKHLKSGAASLKQFYGKCLERVGEQEKDRFTRMVNEYAAVLVSKHKHNETLKEYMAAGTWEFDDREQMEDAAEMMMEGYCRNCRKNPAECSVRKLFSENEIEPANMHAGEGECQYKYEEA